MNKTVQIFVLLSALTVPALSGCGGGGSDSTPISPLVGIFHETSISASSGTITCPGSVILVDKSTDSCGTNDTVQFRSDSTFTITQTNGQTASGTWQFTNSTLTLKIAGSSTVAAQTISGPATLTNNNNTLTLTSPDGTSTNNDVYTRGVSG